MHKILFFNFNFFFLFTESSGLSKEEFDEWFIKCWVPQTQARDLIAEAFRTIFKCQESETGRYPIDNLIEILQTRGQERLDDEEAESLRKELEIMDLNGDKNIDADGMFHSNYDMHKYCIKPIHLNDESVL